MYNIYLHAKTQTYLTLFGNDFLGAIMPIRNKEDYGKEINIDDYGWLVG